METKPFPKSQKEGETSDEKGGETQENGESPESIQQPVTLRRSTRERRTPKRYEDSASSFALIIEDGEPSCYQEVVDDADRKIWRKAIGQEEF